MTDCNVFKNSKTVIYLFGYCPSEPVFYLYLYLGVPTIAPRRPFLRTKPSIFATFPKIHFPLNLQPFPRTPKPSISLCPPFRSSPARHRPPETVSAEKFGGPSGADVVVVNHLILHRSTCAPMHISRNPSDKRVNSASRSNAPTGPLLHPRPSTDYSSWLTLHGRTLAIGEAIGNFRSVYCQRKTVGVVLEINSEVLRAKGKNIFEYLQKQHSLLLQFSHFLCCKSVIF